MRLQAWAVWDALTFALNGLVFVLIGLQLPYVMAGIHSYSVRQLLFYGATFSALLILLRLMWMYPGAHVAYFVRKRILHQDYTIPSSKQIFVVGWTGMRGVVALAAAMSLPEKLAEWQSLSAAQPDHLSHLQRHPGDAGSAGADLAGPDPLVGTCRASAVPTARSVRHVASCCRPPWNGLEQAQDRDGPEFASVYDDLRQHYQHRLSILQGSERAETGWKRRVSTVARWT